MVVAVAADTSKVSTTQNRSRGDYKAEESFLLRPETLFVFVCPSSVAKPEEENGCYNDERCFLHKRERKRERIKSKHAKAKR